MTPDEKEEVKQFAQNLEELESRLAKLQPPPPIDEEKMRFRIEVLEPGLHPPSEEQIKKILEQNYKAQEFLEAGRKFLSEK